MNENDFFDEPPAANEISLTELDELCKKAAQQRAVIDDLEGKLKAESNIYQSQMRTIQAHLEHAGKTSYPVPGVGTFIVTERLSCSVPKEMGDKEALFKYIREKRGVDALRGLLTINSQTLTALVKEEFELAAKEGRSTEFRLPGIGELKYSRTTSIRKGK